MKKYLLIIIGLLCIQQLFAQQRTITGTVTEGKEKIPGVTVLEKNQNNGTTSDGEGNFKITLKGNSQVLVVSSVGYLTKEVNVAGRSKLVIDLQPDAKGIEEVVVVGYGTQKKITNTGAISSIKGDDIRQTPTASIQNALIGRLPGFTSQQRSGRPGSDGASFLIRGLSTPNDGAPLIIVDDVEFTQPISELDPDQVESISLLKDAATTAIYGVRGANGVMVITTRRGKLGKPVVTLRSEAGFQTPTNQPHYLDAYQSALLVNEGYVNAGQQPLYNTRDLQLFQDGTDPYGHPNVNWTKTLIRPSASEFRENLNISGGVDKARYFISAGYLSQGGLLQNFDDPNSQVNTNYYYRRSNFRSNLDIQATKTLALKLDLSGAFNEINQPNIGGRNGRNNAFYEISDYNQLPPFAYPIYNPDGSYGANSATAINNNIVGRIALSGYNRDYYNDITGNLKAVQKLDMLTKGLSAMINFSYNGRYQYWRSLTRGTASGFPSFIYNPVTDTYAPKNNTSRIEKYSLVYGTNGGNSYKRLNYLASLNYDRTFGGNHVYGLALLNDQNAVTGTGDPAALRGLTGRLGYDYKRKYLIEFTAGYNGSNRFPEGSRYGFFPAVAAGWNISEEEFFKKHIHFVDLLKFRGSYGLTGSDKVYGNTYIYLQTYANGGSYSVGESNNSFTGITEGALGNIVSWEKEKVTNVGMDLTMFKGKVTATVEVFRRYRYDILQPRASVPSLIGVDLPPANLWRVQNRGFEVDLGYNNNIGNLNYSLRGNVSYARNKVLERDEPRQPYPWLSLTGQPMGTILGYTFLGYYTAADIADPKVAKPAAVGAANAGDLKYLDRNGDGLITTDDQTVLKYPNLPNTIIGFTPSFSYKGFSITATFQSALNFALRGIAESVVPFVNNFRDIHQNAWRPDNQENPSFPRIATNIGATTSHPANYVSDYWMRRGDYLRLKTMEIGYTLPAKFVNKFKFSGVRVYANGYNLATWALVDKNIYQIDPENNSGQDGSAFYPQTKIFNFGLQLTF
ncbi:TonB-dependent receptor [Mucilaginibacter sp. PAMB04168]|uniref:SusC/RagA family TonB-linked outer membrane protein n=1 Tax=Mucilaginibacter sp. PAMB04168 TaxID=3138567 RepID=UPI0031F5F877